MNIISILIKRLIVFFGLISWCLTSISGQNPIAPDEPGIPLVQKFYFQANFVTSGKVSVYEDPSGIFLLGSKNKIILFYGNEFNTIPIKGQANISSNFKSIFYTGYNSLGLIKLFKNNDPKLIPLINEVIASKYGFGQINNVFVVNDLILFNNDKKLFQFDGTNFQVIDSSVVKIQVFKVNDTLYVHKYETGLSRYFMGTLDALPNGGKFAGKEIECFLSFKNRFLVKFKDTSQFYLYTSKGAIEPIVFGFEDYIEKAGFADAINLPENRLAIATKSAGVLIYNLNFDYIQKIGMNEGLANNIAHSLYLDKAGNLWVVHNIGISRIELNFPVTQYTSFAGINGTIYDITKYNGDLFLGTSNGLLKGIYSTISGTSRFRRLYFSKIEGIINECTKLYETENHLIAVTPTGIYTLKNSEHAALTFQSQINSFDRLGDSGLFVYALENELVLLKFNNGEFIRINKINIDQYTISEISAESDSKIWVRTSNNLLFLVNYYKGPNRLSYGQLSYKYGSHSESEPFYIVKTKNGTRFCFADSVLKFQEKNNKLVIDNNMLFNNLNGILVHAELASDRFNLFQVSNPSENLQGVLMYESNKNEDSIRSYFFHTGSLYSPVFHDKNEIWIGGENKLLRFDNSKNFSFFPQHTAVVKKLIIGKDSVLQVGLDDPEIKYAYNDVKFLVSSTSFQGEPYNKYQYKLVGLEYNWSDWQKLPEISYSDLRPGDYILLLRTLNVDGTVSAITEFRFSILPPFYLTIPAFAVYLVIFLFVIFVALRYRTWRFLKYKEFMERVVNERTEEIMREKEKSEILIANLLPKNTADELKLTGKASSQKFSMVTVLFSDIEGFTRIAEQMNPELLIDELDAFFFHFDMVVEKYNIEKIKTIGDAYMCAGGIPDKNITNPVEVVLAALEMQEYMRELKSKNSNIWDLRIGIHTGSVIAGVVGHKKMSYDIWGDTVNTASRMESSGEPGKVNVSGQTYELIKDFFICEYRGKMPVKYKGEIDMYFVKCIRPELSVDLKHIPNKKFQVMLQLLRLQDVEDLVLERMSKELPSNLYFHNISRIKEIYSLVDLFGRAEDLSDEENLILRTAALFQDMGFIISYDNHEDESIKLLSEILPTFKYTQDQINQIVQLVEVSKRLRKPYNRMEEILIDANMNYLSRADFISINDAYYFELQEREKVSDKEDWNKMQIVLLSNHKYYTRVANMLRDVNPEQQIENLIRSSQKSDPS